MSFLDCLKIAAFVFLAVIAVLFTALIVVVGIILAPWGLLLLPATVFPIALAIWAVEESTEI